MSRLIVFLVGSLVLNASNVLGTEPDTTTHSCGDTIMTFEGWKNWTSVTPKPVRSKAHSNNWVGIYVNKLAETTYLSASSPYQVCAKVVKSIFTGALQRFPFELSTVSLISSSPAHGPPPDSYSKSLLVVH